MNLEMRAYRHPIYGARPRVDCTDAFVSAFADLATLIESIIQTISMFFPAAVIMSTIIGEAKATMILPPQLFVRLIWKQRYEGTIFCKTSIIHRLQLKGIYLEYGADYTTDPLFTDELGRTLV